MVCDNTGPSNVDALLKGSASNGCSSAALNWDGLLVHRRKSDSIDRAGIDLDQHHVLVWEEEPSIWERADETASYSRHVKRPGSVSIGMAGIQPAVRSLTPFKVIVGLIAPTAVAAIALETDLPKLELNHDYLGGNDVPLSHLILLSAVEAESGGPSGQLYSASLVMAIISRFIYLAHLDQNIDIPHGPVLSKARLRRVIDKMKADFTDDLSVETLAAESGYSRAHFLRMFRGATGKTPHKYLQDLRLEFAHQQLILDDMSIADIAYAAGFSSHAHLTKLFGEKFGTTPSLFRRDR